MECIFKEKESLDLKILWLSCCHSPDLWSGAAKLIYSSSYNIELNRIRKGLCLISGDAKSLSANTERSWQKGRRNTSTLNTIVYSWRYLGILIFRIMVFCVLGICVFSKYPECFDNPKYGPMVINLWKDCTIQFRAITHGFPSHTSIIYGVKIGGFHMPVPHLVHNSCSHCTAGCSEV